jgi:hypothetical protein
MSEDKTNHILIPALLAAAAAYFGFKGKSEQIADVTKQVVNKAIAHQTQVNNSKKNKRLRRYKKNKRSIQVFKFKK